jgi:hypothetical protein
MQNRDANGSSFGLFLSMVYDARMKAWSFLGTVGGFYLAMVCFLQAQPTVASLSPKELVVEAGSIEGRAILRGSGLKKMQDVRSHRDGETNDFIVGRPVALTDGSWELRMLVRPDAPLGIYPLLVVGEGWTMPVPGTIEVVEPGNARAQKATQGQDLNEMARRSRNQTIVADRDQVPLIMGSHPDPLVVAPDGQTHIIRLAGKNFERVTDVRIRREKDEPRYRQNQGKLPFSRQQGFLDIRLVSGPQTPLGTKYWLDLMVENFRAASVLLEVGTPPPVSASPTKAQTSPVLETPAPAGPRVIELPGPKSLSK